MPRERRSTTRRSAQKGQVLFSERDSLLYTVPQRKMKVVVVKTMKNTKFVVQVNRGGTRALEYVRRIDRSPIQMTFNRKLALIMGKFIAEDTAKSISNSRCSPELLPVQVRA